MIDELVIVTPGFPENEEDTTCIPTLQEYLLAFKRQNPKTAISVVTMQYPNTTNPYHWHGILVTPCYAKIGRIYKWYKALRILLSLTTNKKAIVHSFWLTEASFMVSLLRKIRRFTWVTTAMGQDVLEGNKYLSLTNLSQSKVVCLSKRSKEQLSSAIPKLEIDVIPFGIKELEIKEVEKDIDVIGVGSLIPLKQFDLFLEVIKILTERRPSIKAVIIGEGPEQLSLLELSKKLGLTNTVSFIGKQPRNEVFSWMNRGKVLLHTSSIESQGYVFNEALSMKCKIVSTEVGIAEASDVWGIAKDTKSLADLVRGFLETKPVETTQNFMDIKETVEAYQKLYNHSNIRFL